MMAKRGSDWTNEQIVEHVRKWAVERAKCGFDAAEANRISEQELFPLEEILQSRGRDALLKLLPLTTDDDPVVRLVAASFVFDVAPKTAQQVLMALMRESNLAAILAWAVWSHKDPASAPGPEFIGRANADPSS